jgi:hypothetical protein
MANYLRPRRGKRSTAESQNIILKKGEIFMEAPETGVGKGRGRIKIGDGVTAYTSLPYFYDYTNFVTDLIDSTISFTQTAESDNTVLLNRIASGAKVSIITAAEKNLLSNLNNSVSDIKESEITFTETSEADNDVLLSTIASGAKISIITAAEKNLLSNLNTICTTLRTEVDALNTLTSNHTSSIDSINRSITTINGSISTLNTNVNSLITEKNKYVYSAAVSAGVGATSTAISNSAITTSSLIEVFYQSASGDVPYVTKVVVAAGRVTIYFEALTVATSFRLRISNV